MSQSWIQMQDELHHNTEENMKANSTMSLGRAADWVMNKFYKQQVCNMKVREGGATNNHLGASDISGS